MKAYYSSETNRRQSKFVGVMPRWFLPDDLKLKSITKNIHQSMVDGYWYHSNPSGRSTEVRGPYRTRKLAIDAYDCFKAEMLFEMAEVKKAVTGGREGERW